MYNTGRALFNLNQMLCLMEKHVRVKFKRQLQLAMKSANKIKC